MKKVIYAICRILKSSFINHWNQAMVNSQKIGYRSLKSDISYPSYIVGAENVFLYDYTRLQGYHTILCTTAKFIMKQYSAAAVGLTVVTGNHVSTVGIPHYFLGMLHINDREEDVVVDEDVWIGTRVTLLAGSHVGRGCIIGAGALITKKTQTPPYAVVVGCPAKIIASKFSIEQIIEHEKKLYPQNERLSREELKDIFETYFTDKPVLGVDYNLSQDKELQLLKVMKSRNFRYPNIG